MALLWILRPALRSHQEFDSDSRPLLSGHVLSVL
jgi:hypothetical protein